VGLTISYLQNLILIAIFFSKETAMGVEIGAQVKSDTLYVQAVQE
jgi:hypothetical protein